MEELNRRLRVRTGLGAAMTTFSGLCKEDKKCIVASGVDAAVIERCSAALYEMNNRGITLL
jgi:hypothetical protein